MNLSFRLNNRNGDKDTTEFVIDQTGDTISIDEYTLTATESRTSTFNVGSGYMLQLLKWRFNLNANLMYMNYSDNINSEYDFSNNSLMFATGADTPLPLRVDLSYGYSVNSPEMTDATNTVYNIFNSRFTWFWFDKKLTTYAGIDYLTSDKDQDPISFYGIDNNKRILKLGLKWKINNYTVLGFQFENIDFNDAFEAPDYEEGSFTENRMQLRFDYRL